MGMKDSQVSLAVEEAVAFYDSVTDPECQVAPNPQSIVEDIFPKMAYISSLA